MYRAGRQPELMVADGSSRALLRVTTTRARIVALLLCALLVAACDAGASGGAVRGPDAGGAARASAGAGPDPAADDAPPRALPAVPDGWPATVELGMASGAGGARDVAESAPFAFRYQYLAGGVNTGAGWATWSPGGSFVTSYVEESLDAGLIPVFTYYMLYQSTPGRDVGEADGVAANLADPRTMAAYYRDLRLFFERADAAGGTVVLHVEPDLWAFMQQRASDDDAATVPVHVDASGMADVAGLPDTAAGLAQAVVQLRDSYAPDVILGYHVSAWGTGEDILLSDPPHAQVRSLGRRAADFYASLGAPFDIAFTDIADRDAAFKEANYDDGGATWLDDADYRRSASYIGAFVGDARIRVVLWQLPYGNTRMRAVDNTWGHYQDNKVETLLDQPDRRALHDYTEAGVVAYLFGGGAEGVTCACDAQGDGLTDPAPINGNERRSLSADDDGGYFRERAAHYYETGAVPLGD